MQRHSFALECLFRSERPLTDSKLKAVRERVRHSFSRLRLIAPGTDDLQNAGQTPLLTRAHLSATTRARRCCCTRRQNGGTALGCIAFAHL